jgi:Protein of unknown function (DUF4019)
MTPLLAQQSSEAWLSLTDSGNYAESYQEAAQHFKDSITNDKWQSAMHAVRDSLGKVLSRKLKSTTYAKTLPGHRTARMS